MVGFWSRETFYLQGRIFRWGVGERKARKIFGDHAHFTCRFRLREVACAYIILQETYTIRRDIDARDWTDSRTGLALKR